ncbi:MAG: VOC family protein [Bacteroidota bacterium]|nr:VOC family protein [Bacteroidota bacterium]
MRISQIKETCLYSRDLDRAQEFYADILQLPIIGRVEQRHVFFRAGASVLLIFNPDLTANATDFPQHYGEGALHIAFEVPESEYAKWKIWIADAGIAITHEHDWPGGRKSFYFNDPDGHVLEFVMPGIWE